MLYCICLLPFTRASWWNIYDLELCASPHSIWGISYIKRLFFLLIQLSYYFSLNICWLHLVSHIVWFHMFFNSRYVGDQVVKPIIKVLKITHCSTLTVSCSSSLLMEYGGFYCYSKCRTSIQCVMLVYINSETANDGPIYLRFFFKAVLWCFCEY